MILFDTCAILHIEAGLRLTKRALDELAAAIASYEALISPVSAWEIGKMASVGRLASPVPPIEIYRRFVSVRGVKESPLTPSVMIASSFLPGSYNKDPWDRILIATARETGARILTCDRALLAYSAEGHVRTVAY